MQRQLAALQSRGGDDEAFFDAVLKTLRELLPGVDSIKVKADGVEMTGPEVGKGVPIAGVSDGYVGTIGWILDLIARWSYRYQRLTGKQPGGSIAKEMRGLVVVDEMGLHLAPRWQTSVVREVRERFPNMSFIVTSHHPLMLLGARPAEIHVLRRDPKQAALSSNRRTFHPALQRIRSSPAAGSTCRRRSMKTPSVCWQSIEHYCAPAKATRIQRSPNLIRSCAVA